MAVFAPSKTELQSYRLIGSLVITLEIIWNNSTIIVNLAL